MQRFIRIKWTNDYRGLRASDKAKIDVLVCLQRTKASFNAISDEGCDANLCLIISLVAV
jgi:hypothetical protein